MDKAQHKAAEKAHWHGAAIWCKVAADRFKARAGEKVEDADKTTRDAMEFASELVGLDYHTPQSAMRIAEQHAQIAMIHRQEAGFAE